MRRDSCAGQLPDAHELAAAIAAGAQTPADVVEDAIARIEAADPLLNAVIHRRFENARREATRVGHGRPFRGVPLLVKDALCSTRGDPYHFGMRLLREVDWHARHDSYLAQRFRRAGFVLLGRTNTPELAGSYSTEPVAYGPTRNPWNLTRSPGGSSGGSAAAVAAGYVPVAHGNDTGGSIRVPASMCGVIGVKPTRAAISLGPEFGEFRGFLTCEGIFTRTVRDAAAVLRLIAGGTPGDPYLTPAGIWQRTRRRRPRQLRIGLITRPPGGRERVHPACESAAFAVAEALEQAGHRVAAVQIPAFAEARYEPDIQALVAVGMRRDLDRWAARLGRPIGADDVEPWTWDFASKAESVSSASYASSVEALQATCREISDWWRGHVDILVTPAVPGPAPALGFVSRGETDVGVFARPFNVTGQPALSIPAAHSEDGLPIGVQLVASAGQDGLLLHVAEQIEAALPGLPVRPDLASAALARR